jgi:hypothetical protein
MTKLTSRTAVCTIALLAGCGSGGDYSGTGTPAPSVKQPTTPQINTLQVRSAGIYDLRFGSFWGVYIFLDNGQFYGIHFVNPLQPALVGHPRGQLSSKNSNGTPEPIAWANFAGDSKGIGSQHANTLFGRTVGADLLEVTIDLFGRSAYATADHQKSYSSDPAKSLYADTLPFSALTGTYKGYMRTVGFEHMEESIPEVTIHADGTFSTVGAHCKFQGKMVRRGATAVFDAQAEASGDDCFGRGQMTGIVTPLDVKNGVAELAFLLNSLDQQRPAVLLATRP